MLTTQGTENIQLQRSRLREGKEGTKVDEVQSKAHGHDHHSHYLSGLVGGLNPSEKYESQMG